MYTIIGMLDEREKSIRKIAKLKGVKIRNVTDGIKLYYSNGSQYLVSSWSYIEEILETGQCVLYDKSIYKPKLLNKATNMR
jgi:hypothetical protein